MTMSQSDRSRRFLTLADVAEVLAVDLDTVRALVDTNELAAIRIGEGGQWRVEEAQLERFIADQYERRDREARLSEAAFVDLPEFSTRF